MRIFKLALAAALVVSGLTAAPAAASADQRGDRWERRDNDRGYNRGDRGRRDWRGQSSRRDRWRGHRGRYGYNRGYNRGRHYGWRGNRYRQCRWAWRYGHRQRICWWSYRRWR